MQHPPRPLDANAHPDPWPARPSAPFYNRPVNLLNADLHCHSVVSDGTLSPEALAERAKSNGVELWSLTDHDEVDGQQRAAAAAKSLGLDYLSGCEISVSFAGTTVHIVGLGFDATDRALPASGWPSAMPVSCPSPTTARGRHCELPGSADS